MIYFKKTTTTYLGGGAENWGGFGQEVEIRMSKSPARASGLKPLDEAKGDALVWRTKGDCALTPVCDQIETGTC
tara:strand:+ start:257 stop:478 length:222 start_codon:yes stop_codon:yes gene_type:complete